MFRSTMRQCVSMAIPPDESLMLAVARGDLAAFEQLVLRHQETAWRTAHRFVADRHAAEDIAQNAFLKVLEAAPRYRPTAAFRTYLYRIIVRLCLDHRRKRRPALAERLSHVPQAAPSAEEQAVRGERERAVRKALSRLRPKQRIAIVLRYYEGLSGREIAAAMETTVKAVERLLARGRATLEGLLADFFEG